MRFNFFPNEEDAIFAKEGRNEGRFCYPLLLRLPTKRRDYYELTTDLTNNLSLFLIRRALPRGDNDKNL